MEDKKYCMNCMQPLSWDGTCPHCGLAAEKISDAPHHIPHGSKLFHGKYLVGRVLGEGGFGITYIGLDLTLLIAVAIKEYFPNGLVWRKCDKTRSSYQVTPYTPESKVLFERGKDDFLKEARVLSQFGTQEGIVCTRSFFEENDSVYLVMDYVRGGSIKDYVKRNGPFSPQNCWNILHNPIRALLDLHQRGLVHQDVSPDNVIINAEGNGVLIDFGAVRHANAIDDKTRTSIYKQGFSAYEQLEKRGQRGPWTDVYSLCATIYYMLTGQAPIDATERVFNDTIKPLWEYPVDITKDVAEVIMHGLAVESSTRLQTLDELYETLYECPAHRKDMAEVVESASVLGESREAMREEALGKQKRRERHIHHLSDQLEQMERRRKHKKWVAAFGIMVGVLAVISGIRYRQMAADHGKAEMKPPVIASAEPTRLPEDQAGRSVVPQADAATASTEPSPTATEPVRTKKPKVTKRPVRTNKPKATKHPVRTKKPKVIKTPEVAATPKRTKAPKRTKKPTKIHMDGDMDELTE